MVALEVRLLCSKTNHAGKCYVVNVMCVREAHRIKADDRRRRRRSRQLEMINTATQRCQYQDSFFDFWLLVFFNITFHLIW